MTAPLNTPVEVIVCSTCRRGASSEGDDLTGARPGALLHRALAAQSLPDGITVRAVECLSNCTRGCSIALRGPGRWTYVYGNLDETADIETIVDGVIRYHRTTDGLVPWRERPLHFRKNCIARIPPLEATLETTTENAGV